MELEAARGLAMPPVTPGTVFEFRVDGKTAKDMELEAARVLAMMTKTLGNVLSFE